MSLSTIVYDAHTQINQTTDAIYYSLKESDRSIPPGLTDRLVRYAKKRMTQAGFPCFEEVSVSFVEQHQSYHVSFKNEKGGIISVDGIFIGPGGHPNFDHGFNIDYRWTNS